MPQVFSYRNPLIKCCHSLCVWIWRSSVLGTTMETKVSAATLTSCEPSKAVSSCHFSSCLGTQRCYIINCQNTWPAWLAIIVPFFLKFLMINSAVAHTVYWQSSMFQVSTLHFPVNWFRHGLAQRPKEFHFMSAHFCFLQETFTDFYTLTCFIILWVIAANLFPCFCLTVRLPAGARRVSTISWTSSVSWLAVHTRVSLWMSPILLAKT